MKFRNIHAGRIVAAAKTGKLTDSSVDQVIARNAETYKHATEKVRVSVSEEVFKRLGELSPAETPKATTNASEDGASSTNAPDTKAHDGSAYLPSGDDPANNDADA